MPKSYPIKPAPTGRGRQPRHPQWHGIPQTSRPKTANPLQPWMKAQGITLYSLALAIGACAATVKLWADGRGLPSLIYAFKLDKVTSGAVPPSSWLGTELGKAQWNVTADYQRRLKYDREAHRSMRAKAKEVLR